MHEQLLGTTQPVLSISLEPGESIIAENHGADSDHGAWSGGRGEPVVVPTVLNILQCPGWAVFELVTIATAADTVAPGLSPDGAGRVVQGLRPWKVRRRSLTQASGFSQGMKWPPWSWALTLTWLNHSACGLVLNAWTRSLAVWMPGGFS
jgi:hypothetical protein